MDKEVIPVVINMSANNTTGNPSSTLNVNYQENIMENTTNATGIAIPSVSNTRNGDSTAHSQRRTSNTKNRKKSRRMSRVQGCSDEEPNANPAKVRPELALPAGKTVSALVNASLTSFDSVDSSSSPSTSPTLTARRDHKINRIFSMLQKMQHNYLPQQQQQQPDQSKPPQYQLKDSDSANTIKQSEVGKHENIRSLQLQPDLSQSSMSSGESSKRLFGLGRSQDSLMSAKAAGSMTKSQVNHHRRLGSINSWNGSQCSGFTTTTAAMTEGPTEGPTPPLVHAMPYHKDGW